MVPLKMNWGIDFSYAPTILSCRLISDTRKWRHRWNSVFKGWLGEDCWISYRDWERILQIIPSIYIRRSDRRMEKESWGGNAKAIILLSVWFCVLTLAKTLHVIPYWKTASSSLPLSILLIFLQKKSWAEKSVNRKSFLNYKREKR